MPLKSRPDEVTGLSPCPDAVAPHIEAHLT